MRIAIDAREMADPRTGKARYVAELVRALAELPSQHEFILYVWSQPPGKYPKHFTFVILPTKPGLRFLWVAKNLVERKADVFLSPTGYHPILFTTVPSVLVIHDLAVLVEPRGKPAWKTKLMERLGLPLATRKASHIITVSRHTARDVGQHFPHTKGKVTAIPLAPFPLPEAPTTQSTLVSRYRLPRNFSLFVGTLEPRKNVDGLLAAYGRLDDDLRRKFPLVLVGRRGWNSDELGQAIERATAAGWLRELGGVPDADLPGLYELATLFVYPSWYEGFGLPPLEAMRAGTPVVTSNTSSIPEVVGSAALTVDPSKPAELTRAIDRVLTDAELRAKLRKAGSARAKQFSWAKTAERTLAVLEQVAKEHSQSS